MVDSKKSDYKEYEKSWTERFADKIRQDCFRLDMQWIEYEKEREIKARKNWNKKAIEAKQMEFEFLRKKEEQRKELVEKFKEDSIQMEREEHIPSIFINLKNQNFKIGAGKKARIEIMNRGKMTAKNICAEISNLQLWDIQKIAVKILSKIELLKPDETNFIDIWIKSDLEGEVPIEFLFKYTDDLNRDYDDNKEIWINVSDSPINSGLNIHNRSDRDIPKHSLSISRTIFDPAIKDFIFESDQIQALPNVRKWIDNHNPLIYWYILRIDNIEDVDISQWAMELYADHALSITEAYIEGSDRRFDLKKRERDAWSEKHVLSIPRQMGIPIVGKGTRRLYFKLDINCKEGLMHEYGISGIFKVQGMKDVEIREKMFKYSCKVGEFKQIFDNNPDEASIYAEKRLIGRYSSNSVHIFTNSFRMIYELSKYCRSGSSEQDVLISRLQMLQANFEKVPEIAGERIIPLIVYELDQLASIKNKAIISPGILDLCDTLVEYMHIEVVGAS